MYEKEVEIKNRAGIHARPSAIICQIAYKYKCTILIRDNNGEVHNAKSIMGLINAVISYGTIINIIADGEDEVNAVENIANAIENRFEEYS